VCDASGRPFGAVSITGPADRWDLETIRSRGPTLRDILAEGLRNAGLRAAARNVEPAPTGAVR